MLCPHARQRPRTVGKTMQALGGACDSGPLVQSPSRDAGQMLGAYEQMRSERLTRFG